MNEENGNFLWSYKVGDGEYIYSSAAVTQNKVFVTTFDQNSLTGYLYALSPFQQPNFQQPNLSTAKPFNSETVKVPPYILPLKGATITEDMARFWDAVTELRENGEKPVLTIVGYDTLEYIYEAGKVLKILGEDIARTKNFEDLRVN
ncbi:MAG: PQQ-binding-like beta-propeller repeat protein, partial [Nitrososphaerales archaeon]